MPKRFDIDSGMRGETLVRKGLMRRLQDVEQIRIVPNLNVIKIGGHGMIDYGREVVFPLVEELGALSKKHQIMVVTGGGGRVRHIMDIGIDLGLPTGVLAELSSKISEQNAIIMSILLSKYNGSRIHTSDLLQVSNLLAMGMIPVTHGTPPYGLYEHPPRVGSIPPHRTDTGAFLIAEVLGAKNCILAKNVDGLYSEDPRVNSDAEFIPEITAQELLARDMEDMVVERMAVELLQSARNVKELIVVNGHTPGIITKAVGGERVGTIIRA